MNEEVPNNLVSGQCPDELTLQLYAEGEADAPAAELIFHHLAHCQACSARLGQLRELKFFCLERLGEEDVREVENTRRVLLAVRQELRQSTLPAPPSLQPARWRQWLQAPWLRVAVVAASVLVVLGASLWLLSERQPGLSAKAVLDEAVMRERLWEQQPGKVLHWVIESTVHNSEMLPDGSYRTLYWRSNTPGQTISLMRKYDEQNRLQFAQWTKADGSQIVCRNQDEFTIYPDTAAMREQLAKLPAEKRQQVEQRFGIRQNDDAAEDKTRQALEIAQRQWSEGKLRLLDTPEAGRVFRLTLTLPQETAKVKAGEMEQDFSAETFRRLRLGSRRVLPDGRVRTEESRWVLFRESSLAELDANDLSQALAQAKKVKTIAAQEYLQTLLASLESATMRK